MEIPFLNLLAAWISILGGVVSGALIGLFFHKEQWLGGYNSFPRRMLRLGHIAFFGLAFLNLAFAQTVHVMGWPAEGLLMVSLALLIGNITMPLCCFLTAWRKPFRHLFPVPVISLGYGILGTLNLMVRT